MKKNEAKKLIELMSDGFDPRTGEKLPNDHLLNDLECVRALSFALNAIEFHKSSKKRFRPKNHGNSWSETDDKLLLEMFNAGVSNGKIAQHLGRNINGIKGRLHRLGAWK